MIIARVNNGFYRAYDTVRPRNPVTGQRELHLIPEWIEISLGTARFSYDVGKAGGVVLESDRKYGHYAKLVKEIGLVLAAHTPRNHLPYEFVVVDDKKDNAWCLPGGKIAVNIGLLKKMERDDNTYDVGRFTLREKVAAVLSHEITHASARHGGRALEFKLLLALIINIAKQVIGSRLIDRVAKRDDLSQAGRLTKQQEAYRNMWSGALDLSGQLLTASLTLCGSRKHELEADKYGMHLLWNNGKGLPEAHLQRDSARAAIWIQSYFQAHEFKSPYGWLNTISAALSSHPPHDLRRAANERTWRDLKAAAAA